jgi:hypothetical protein
MQAQILAQYSLNGPLTHVVALGGGRAVCLSNWGRSAFVFSSDTIRHIHLNEKQELINYGAIRQRRGWPDHWPPDQEGGEFFFPSGHDHSALFAYEQGFGAVYDNAVYLCRDIESSITYLPITKLLPPHHKHSHFSRSPVVASYILNSHQLTLALSEYHCAAHGKMIGKLNIEADSAAWDDQLYDLDFQELESKIKHDPRFDQQKTMYEQICLREIHSTVPIHV